MDQSHGVNICLTKAHTVNSRANCSDEDFRSILSGLSVSSTCRPSLVLTEQLRMHELWNELVAMAHTKETLETRLTRQIGIGYKTRMTLVRKMRPKNQSLNWPNDRRLGSSHESGLLPDCPQPARDPEFEQRLPSNPAVDTNSLLRQKVSGLRQ